MKLFDDLIEKSAELRDQAVRVAGEAFEQSKVVAGEAMDKGKKKMSEISLKADLSKAQKDLGALVYAMHKSGEKDEELLNKYFDDIAEIEEKIAALGEPVRNEKDEYDFSIEDIEKAADDIANNISTEDKKPEEEPKTEEPEEVKPEETEDKPK